MATASRENPLLTNDQIHAIVFNTFGMHRFLQDSPIRPDVWERFLVLAARGEGEEKISLILTPKRRRSTDGLPIGRATELSMAIARSLAAQDKDGTARERSADGFDPALLKVQKEFRIAATSRHVVIDVTFENLIYDLLPLTDWWRKLPEELKDIDELGDALQTLKEADAPIRQALMRQNNTEFYRFVALAGLMKYLLDFPKKGEGRAPLDRIVAALAPFVVPSAAGDGDPSAEDPDDYYQQRRRERTGRPTLSDLQALWDCYAELIGSMQARRARRDWLDKHASDVFEPNRATIYSDTAIWAIQRNRRAARQAGAKSWKPAGRDTRPTPVLSRNTVKADASMRLFSISTRHLVWAIVDTGVDALHPAFCNKTESGLPLIDQDGNPVKDREGKSLKRPSGPFPPLRDGITHKRDLAHELDLQGIPYECWLSDNENYLIRREGNWLVAYDWDPETPRKAPKRSSFLQSRVGATLDFTVLRKIINGELETDQLLDKVPWGQLNVPGDMALRKAFIGKSIDAIRRHNISGREIDWSLIEPLIRIDPYAQTSCPLDPHGTHVAGILAADLPAGLPDEKQPFFGVCPDIQLYDLRVFSDDEDDGGGDEFTVLAALDYISWINRDPERPGIHGVNLSLAIRHIVDAHACGGTPICDAANRMVWAGTVVVAAAGNFGFDPRYVKASLGVGYRGMSIADPGNAEQVITTGATHSSEPHTYGVSYFSSRGPTGDGRRKPDLVAPGEKIRSTVPRQQMLVLDGTSMAAPHVSGVCALLMARHSELIGEPERIKSILMKTATDLGREHYFQGAGLVDSLRALQAV